MQDYEEPNSPLTHCPECKAVIIEEEYRDGFHLRCSSDTCTWKKEYPSCTCLVINCDCPCISGGLDGDGNVTSNLCFNDLCIPHGDKCRPIH